MQGHVHSRPLGNFTLPENGRKAIFPEVSERNGDEAAYSLPSSAEIKECYSIPPLPHTSS
jgi:hypothetical protein